MEPRPATGTVTGRVLLPAAARVGQPPRLSPYARSRYSAPRAAAPALDARDVVVYVASAPPGAGVAADQHARITQVDMTIEPHVTAVPVGARIVFPNEDDVFHNLFSLSEPKRFNLGRYPPGESREVRFDEPGRIRLFCDIHSDMAAVIHVFEHGLFAVPEADGSYRIDGVPAGRHTVVAWHQALPPDSVEIEVAAGLAASADLAPGR